MRMIDNPKQIWKHFSTWAMTAAGSLQAVWLGIPDELRANLPPYAGQVVAWITLVIAIWGIGGKVVNQQITGQTPKEAP